jgi:phosphoribosyl 1,2-cyclic phosphate phosphodiesterase
VLIRTAESSLLIDTATEFRLQALEAGIQGIDGIFFTHAHADHVHGLDDLRPLSHHKPIEVFAAPDTRKEIETRFSYIFSRLGQRGGVPQIHMNTLGREAVNFADVRVQPIPVLHGSLPILGYRIGSCAYLTDCSSIPDTSYPLLEGLDVLIIDALRYRPHPTHFSINQALETIQRIAPRRAFLTHLCHNVEHHTLSHQLPEGIEPAYDGLEIELSYSHFG